jgi:hypothetical protein
MRSMSRRFTRFAMQRSKRQSASRATSRFTAWERVGLVRVNRWRPSSTASRPGRYRQTKD